MRELRIDFVSANVLSHQSGRHFDLRYRDGFLRNRGSRRGRSVSLRNLRRVFDSDKRDEVACQRPTPIEHAMVAIELSVVDRVSLALERVSQITVGREQCGVYQISRRRV